MADVLPVHSKDGKFPCSLVWTPLPVIAWLVPFVGHLGICREDGVVLDFAGSYFVNVGMFAFGVPFRVLPLTPDDGCFPENISSHTCSEPYVHSDYGTAGSWDDALRQTLRQFQNEPYNIFTSNCHSFVACCLNRMAYRGSMQWNVVNLCALMFLRGKWVTRTSAFWAYFPFFAVLGLGWYLTGTTVLIFLVAFACLLVGWFLLGTYVLQGLIKSK